MSRIFTKSFSSLLLIFFVHSLMAKEAPLTAGRGTPIANLSKEVNSLETSGYSEYLIHHSPAAKVRTPLRLQEGLDVTIQSLEASPGDEICLDVTVDNFMNVAALSFTINYDKDILAFDAVTNVVFPNVNEFTFGETFGTPTGPEPIEEGFVTMVWTSPGLQPFNLANGTVIFQVCFTVIGNTTTNVSITSDLTPIDVIDASEQAIMLNATPGVITLPGGDGGNSGGGGADINTEKCSETYNGFTVIANDLSAQPGDQICVDVCVANFTNIAALSLTMNYDDTVLDFDTVTNIVFPNVNQFTYGETFGTPAGPEPIDVGFVTMVWTSPGLQPFNLANGTVIFQVCFTVKANTTAGSTKLEFTSDLTPIDVINSNEQNVPFNGVDGTIDLGGNNNGGGGGTDINTEKCSETYNGFTVVANDVSAQPGDQICVDVCVANFTNIAALSLTMNYDETILDFDTVTNIVFPNVNQFTYGETFGTPAGPEPIDDGFITMVWTSPGLQPFNLADGTVIFQVCFTVKSNTNASSTKLEFTSDLTPIDVINANEQNVPFNGVDGTIAIGGNNGGGGSGGGNTEKCGETYSGFTVVANDVNAQPGDQICMDICVANFTNIAALSMTMEYDENVLEFDTVNSIVFPNVNEFNYGETFGTPTGPEPIDAGFITMVWTSPGLQPFTLADGTVIFQLCFTVKQNTNASSTKVTFSSALTPIDVIDANEQNVPFNSVDGTVFIGDNGGGGGTTDKCSETYNGFTVVINDALAQPGDQVCLDVCVANFTNIAGLSFTIEYDKDLLAFDTVNNIIFPNVDQFNYNETFGTPNGPEPIDEGFITMVWTSPGIQPWSYEDGTVIFQLCFTVIGDQDADVTFSSALTPIDVINADEQNVPFNGVNGKVIIGTLTAPTIVNPVTITNVDCFGRSTGAIDISLEGGSGNFSYAWSFNNRTTQDLTGLPAGQYSLTVTDNVSGLQTQGSFTVNQPAAISVNSVNITDVACAGERTGAITVMAGGGTGPLTYTWSNNLPAGSTQAGLGAGTYRFTVTDANGCQTPSGDLLVRDVNPLLEVNSIVPSSIQTGMGGGVTLSVGGGNGDYTYQWAGPQSFSSTNANLTNLSIPGEYCVTVTDEVGCTVTACTNVFAPLAFGEVSIKRTCPGESSGSITLNMLGGVPDYSYQWNTGATSRNLSGLAAGSYTVTVTDDSGTQVNASFDVSEYTPITIDPDMEPVSAVGAADGSINLNISGGTPPYAVNWENGATGRTLNNLSPGEYCVTITDQNGCVQEGCVNVILLVPLAFEVQKTDIRCNGAASGVLALTVTGGVPPYSVQFSDGTSMSSQDGTVVRNGLTSRQYGYTITDSRGETIQGNTAINQPDPIALSSIDVRHDSEDLGCTGSIVIQVSGGRPGYSVRWNSPNTGVQIVGLCEGLYVPTVVDGNNCEVTLPGIPVTTFSVRNAGITNTSCPMDPTGRIDLNIQGGAAPYTFEWSNEAGEVVSSEEDLSGVTRGKYTVRVTEESGNVITKTFTITAQSNLGINVSVASNFNGFGVSCPDATDGALVAAGINGNGNYSYEWLQGEALVGTSAMLTGVGPGEYQAMVIDELGCEMVQTITLSAPPAITINSNQKDVNCPGEANGEIIVNATGGISTALYSYQWSNGNIGQRNAFLRAGDYAVTVTDINKCSVSQSFNIAEPDPIVVTIETQPATEGCNGVATAIVQGGTPPYNFTWDSETATVESMIDKLCHGNHFLRVTDGRGCLIEQELLQFTVKDRRFPCIEVREVITPDGDGLNERFVINCIEEFPDNTLQIFNRWGQLVYQIEGYDCTDQGGINCFLGETNKGEELPEGAYYYVLEFTDSEGNLVQRKGALTIIRE